MLRVKLLAEGAKEPTVANPGEDLGYDVYALESATLIPGVPTKVRTGIAAEFDVRVPVQSRVDPTKAVLVRMPYGLLIRDRSSMAAKGVIVSGGVVDAGYRGEILVILTLTPFKISDSDIFGTYVVGNHTISPGDKIAQMIPIPVLTNKGVEVVEELSEAQRGASGFGSTGV